MIIKFKLFEEDSYNGIKKFTIPKALRKNTKISNRNLAFVKDWKTKIIACNSCGEGDKIGKWDGVGYTMVNYKTNEIIPIARADEHHTGYDLMWDYQNQGIIKNVGDWISIFWHNNYMFNQPSEKDAIKNATAFEKWLSYGGINTNLLITLQEADYRQKRVELDLQTFVDLKGNIGDLKRFIETDGELTEKGKRFIETLEFWTFYIQRFHNGEETVKEICDRVKRDITKYKILNGMTFINSLYFKTNIIRACNKFDVKKVEELIFSHNGLKNEIHNKLRHDQDNPKLKKYFGNVKVALNKFNILSNI
jgi:hypothetical protein